MPATAAPSYQAFERMLEDLERRLRALETQQQFIVTDPTGGSGDPAHGHAVVVIGSLAAITGINAYGVATYHAGKWSQL